MSEVTAQSLAAWKAAQIPRRFQNLMADSDLMAECLSVAKPDGKIQKWTALFRAGEILRSEAPRTCGLGLWLRGDFEADFVGAAVLQALVLEGHVTSAHYTDVHRLLAAESPEGDGLGTRRSVDLMLIQGLGEHHVTATNWSNTTLHALLRARFDDGLPTIITTPKAPEDSGLPTGFLRQAFYSILFER